MKSSKHTILIIEDGTYEREIILNSLNTIGYLCLSACDSSAGIAMAKKELFDLFIVDIRKQGINSMQVIDQLKAMHPHVPVIAMSWNISDELVERSQNTCFLCMQKPFSMKSLSSLVVTIVGSSSAKPIAEVKHKYRILIVEDNADVRELIEEELLRKGWEIVTAKDGVEAVQRVIDGGLNSVLMDIRMPVLDGIGALRLIRQLDPRLPVIMFTGQATHEEILETKRLGAYACILKPIMIKELLKLLFEAAHYNDATLQNES